MFGMTKNAKRPKMSHTQQITSNKIHTANVFLAHKMSHFSNYMLR